MNWHFDIGIDPNSLPADFDEQTNDATVYHSFNNYDGRFLLEFNNGYSCVAYGYLIGCKPPGLIEGEQPTCEVKFSKATP